MRFDTFDMFDEMPFWDLSSRDMMLKYSWTRLAWCNQRKVAVYLAALGIQDQFGEECLGVLVLTPSTCVWAHSVNFSELLYYFSPIVRAVTAEFFDFTEYAVYAMARFIDAAHEAHGETAGYLIDCLNVADPIKLYDEANVYIEIQTHFKVPPLEDLYLRYSRMLSYDDCEVDTLKRLTWGDIHKKAEVFLADVPALDNIIRDYNETFIKNAEKASEKSEKKPKRTTNVRELLWNSYPHVCGLCGEQINSIDEMHVDHIIPLSRGGKDILANLQLTHARCNMDKGNTLFEESEE